MLVSPTTNRDSTKAALDKLQFADRTATGEGIFTALQAIATVGAVIGGGDKPPPARIVLFSDGKETMPTNPDNPKGAFTAARTAKDQGVPISTISFGTPMVSSRSTTSASRCRSTTRPSRRWPSSRAETLTTQRLCRS